MATAESVSSPNHSNITTAAPSSPATAATSSANSSAMAGRCIVLCGPSGAGKGSVMNQVMNRFPLGFSVSHTTRQPRPGEVDGVHYNFVTHEAMQALIDSNGMIESNHVHGNVYGTSFEAIEKVLRDQPLCLLDIDIQGVMNLRSSRLHDRCTYVMLVPPSMEILEERLRKRGTETEEAIKIRLGTASTELTYREKEGMWDRVVVNDEIKRAGEELADIVAGVLKEAEAEYAK